MGSSRSTSRGGDRVSDELDEVGCCVEGGGVAGTGDLMAGVAARVPRHLS